MFASSYTARHAARHLAGQLYSQVGIETRVSGATPHQLVALLFDGYLECLAKAKGAIRSGNREAKAQALGRAVRIVEEGLRAGLDLRAGGPLARDLNELYNYLTMRLTLANVRDDESMLDECQRLVSPLREAWMAIAPQVGEASR